MASIPALQEMASSSTIVDALKYGEEGGTVGNRVQRGMRGQGGRGDVSVQRREQETQCEP